MDEDGRSRGYGHVDFETHEQAQEASKKSGEVLEGRDVFIELARERGAATYVSSTLILLLRSLPMQCQ